MSSQTLLTPSIITKESLLILENNLVAANLVNRKFENQFVKIGTSLTIRKPNRFTVSSGPGLQIQDIAEPSTSITISNQKHVDWQFSSQDLTLVVEEFAERYLKPAMASLANQVDYDTLQNIFAFSNIVGTPATIPSSFATSVQLTGQRLDELGAPQEDRRLIMNPASYWAVANGLSNNFVTKTSEPALIKGYLSTIGNQELYMDQNIGAQAASVYGGTPLTNIVTPQSGNTVVTDGWTATTTVLAVGTVFTIDGVFNINPQSRQSTGVLKNFTVTTATVTDGSGNSTITFSPAIVTSGAYQNVSAAVADGKAITIKTGLTTVSLLQNFAFCRDAIGLVMVPMEIPGGVDFAARETYKNISMRVIRAYDINNDVFPTRADILYGTAQYYDELGVRLTN
jgi:hypothetical protein